jgi:putative tryptophan/tyrosine transport system substrate-binding protein
MNRIGRRTFIAGLGSAAAWPVVVRAQRSAMPVIGWLGSESREAEDFRAIPFRQGLNQSGYVEGRNVAFAYRWADGQYDRLSALAADLVRQQVNVIVALGTPAALAAKAATSTIPIVFQSAGDPIELGFAASLSRPGGNLTGMISLNVEVAPKQLELVRGVLPMATVIGLLVNPANQQQSELTIRDVQAAARKLGLRLHVLHASAERDFDPLFPTLKQLRADALVFGPDGLFASLSKQLGALTARHAMTAISPYREFTLAGGLMSYGTDITNMFRLVGAYTARILKGERPADLPVQQITKLELVINVKTAKALGLTIPETLLATADEVIQ